MLPNYVEIAGGNRAGTRVPFVRITGKIIEDDFLEPDLTVYIDGRRKGPPCLLIDLDGALCHNEFVVGILDLFRKLRSRIVEDEKLSLRYLIEKTLRLIRWSVKESHFRPRLIFLLSIMRYLQKDYKRALEDVDAALDMAPDLEAQPEFNYLIWHNKAVLSILRKGPEGFSILDRVYRQYAPAPGRGGRENGEEKPSAEASPGGRVEPGAGASAYPVNILPTIASMYNILERAEAKSFNTGLVPDRFAGLPDNPGRNDVRAAKMRLLEEGKAVYRQYLGCEPVDWVERIKPWATPVADGQAVAGPRTHEKKMEGLALVLNVERDEDFISAAFAKNRKFKFKDYESCLETYQDCSGEKNPLAAVKKFVLARKKHFALGDGAGPFNLDHLAGDCREGLYRKLNNDVFQIGTHCRNTGAAVSGMDVPKRGGDLCATKYEETLNAVFGRCGQVANSVLELCDRRLGSLKTARKELFGLFREDENSRDEKILEGMIAAAGRYEKCLRSILYIQDLLAEGCLKAGKNVFEKGIAGLCGKIEAGESEWEKRLAGKTNPWGMHSVDAEMWRTFARAYWPSLMAEHVTGELRKELTAREIQDEDRAVLDRVYSKVTGLARKAVDQLSCLEKNAEFMKRELDGLDVSVVTDGLQKNVRGAILGLNRLVKGKIARPEGLNDMEILGDQTSFPLEIDDLLQFPSRLKAGRTDAVMKLFEAFDEYCPPEADAMRLSRKECHLEYPRLILKKIDALMEPHQGDGITRKFNDRQCRVAVLEAWSRFNDFRLGRTGPGESLRDLKALFDKAFEWRREAPMALWGKAHVEAMERGLSRWKQNDMLHALGCTDFDFAFVKDENDIEEPDYDRPFDAGNVTRDRYEAFVDALGRI